MPRDEMIMRTPGCVTRLHSTQGQVDGTLPLIVEGLYSSVAIQPVTVGIPFPRGVLATPSSVVLSDPTGAGASVQSTALAYWPDGSVKWLLLDFILGPIDGRQCNWSLGWRRGGSLDPIRPEGAL